MRSSMKLRGFVPVFALFVAAPVLQAQPAAPSPSPAASTAKERPLTELPYTPSLDLSALDRSVDPCTDFYRFTCGGWMAKNPIPPDQAAWNVYAKLTEENSEFLWGILEEASHPLADRTPVQQKIGDYFAACMDEVAVAHQGAAPLKPGLDEIAALQSKKDLAALLAREHLQNSGTGFLFGFGSNQDFG